MGASQVRLCRECGRDGGENAFRPVVFGEYVYSDGHQNIDLHRADCPQKRRKIEKAKKKSIYLCIN